MANRILVLSHHKCGTRWLGRYLQAVAVQNNLSFCGTHLSHQHPAADIVFLSNATYNSVSRTDERGVHVVRNPLSIITSAYFSHKSTHALDDWPELRRQRTLLEQASKEEGIYFTAAFIERPDFYNGAVGPLYGLRSWNYDDPSFITLRMEDLVEAPSASLRAAFADLGVAMPIAFPDDADFTFDRFAEGRQIGEIDEASHYRSGSADDWRHHLPGPLIRYIVAHMQPLFERFYPEALA
jgi:hypothetical protein